MKSEEIKNLGITGENVIYNSNEVCGIVSCDRISCGGEV